MLQCLARRNHTFRRALLRLSLELLSDALHVGHNSTERDPELLCNGFPSHPPSAQVSDLLQRIRRRSIGVGIRLRQLPSQSESYRDFAPPLVGRPQVLNDRRLHAKLLGHRLGMRLLVAARGILVQFLLCHPQQDFLTGGRQQLGRSRIPRQA